MVDLRRDAACGLILASAVAGCRTAAIQGTPLLDAGSSPTAPEAPAGRPQVQLTWRLFETTHSLDAKGQARESAVFELLVNGGTPARVALGRRDSLGCTVRDATDQAQELSVVTTLDCHASGHSEYARVQRPSPGELRVEAFGQDEARPGDERPRTGVRTATVSVPADAEIVVEPRALRVPDEVPAN